MRCLLFWPNSLDSRIVIRASTFLQLVCTGAGGCVLDRTSTGLSERAKLGPKKTPGGMSSAASASAETHLLQRIKARRKSCMCSPHFCYIVVVASVMLSCGKSVSGVLLTAVRTCSIPAGCTALMWQHGSLPLLGCVVRSREAHPCLCGVFDTSGGAAPISEPLQFPVLWVGAKQAAQHQWH